ncbi:UNVERIFIED_CONTAM: nlg-1 [Trichonephila clavipes]
MKGLFQRAILQSGSALSPWAIARDALTYTRQVAAHVKCPTKDSAALVACLGKRPVQDILNVPLRVPDHLIAFGPTIDGVVIPGEPADLMEKQNDLFPQYDLLLGVSRIEYYFKFTSQEDRMGIEVNRRDRLLRTLVRNLFTYHLQEIFLTVVNEYTDWSKPDQHPINVLDSTADAMGDALVVAPLIRTGNYHSRFHQSTQKGTYMYVFMYQTEESFFNQRMGCKHGEDVPYVFGAPLVTSLSHFHKNFSRSESSLSEAVMTYWTNFVKYGTLNSSQPASPLLKLVKGEDMWEALDYLQFVLHQNWGGKMSQMGVTRMMLKATAKKRRQLALYLTTFVSLNLVFADQVVNNMDYNNNHFS